MRTRVASVGGKSVTFEQEIVLGDEVATSSRAVLVAWDGKARAARRVGT